MTAHESKPNQVTHLDRKHPEIDRLVLAELSAYAGSAILPRLVDQAIVVGTKGIPRYEVRLERTLERLALVGIRGVKTVTEDPLPNEIASAGIDLFYERPGYFVSSLVQQQKVGFKHLSALLSAAQLGRGRTLICEDDVLFHEGFDELLSRYWQLVPSDADIVFIGFANPIREFESSLQEVGEHLWKGAFWCCHCVIVTAEGAGKILDSLPMHDQIDFFYGRLAHEGVINSYAFRYMWEDGEQSARCAYTPRGFVYQERD
jgi:hypothetical protein